MAALTGAAALAVGVAAPAAAAPAASVAAPTAVPADAPRTAFETSGGATWTTLAQETAFLAEVDRRSDRMALVEVGRSVQGRPITLVQLGSGRVESADDLADEPTGLLLCLQHGNEPAGREGCLITLRDLALDTSASTARFLERTTVLVVPTANPDGYAANTRTNAEGVDINRDHLALVSPEARTVAGLIEGYDPDLLVDVHEYGGTPGLYDRDLIYLWPRNLNVDDRVYREARALGERWVEQAVTAQGFSTGIYGIRDDGVQVAGDEDPRIFRNAAGLKHVPSLLTETYTRVKPGESTTDAQNRRVDANVAAQRGALALLADRAQALSLLTGAAERTATSEGRTGRGRYFFAGADNDPPAAGEVIDPVPCGYTLTAAQYAGVDDQLAQHGVEVTVAAGEVTVSLAQPARSLIPQLLDERAPSELVAASPVACR